MYKCIKHLFVLIVLCDIIYHIPPVNNPPPELPTFDSLREKLERVQYLAALAVTGTSSRSKLYEEIG